MSTSSVLIVEDELIFALDLQQQLSSMGYDAFAIAASCAEALAHAAQRRPDIVLMDIRIDGRRDGVETAAILRRDHGVPVIYLTAQGDDATFERAKESDPYAYLLKPVRSGELRRALEISLQRSALERVIRERERWFSTTLHSLADGVVTFNAEDEIQFVNPAARALALEVQGAVNESQSPLFSMTELRTSEEVSFVDTHGRKRTVIRTKSPVCDEFSVLGKVLVLRDITDEIEAAKNLATSARMASLGTLAAGVAHEINNPLTVIVGNSAYVHDRLNEDASTHVGFEFADLIELETEVQDAAERIRTIVSGMMAFAHPGQKAATLTSVEEVVERSVKTTRYDIQDRVRLITALEPNLPNVAIDSGKLGQVLINLIANASHAMPSNDRNRNLIEIKAVLAGNQVQITVSDNGKGMSEETMNQVFDPFFTTKEVGRGTGLGLSICHGIIGSAGGTISVQSSEGVGTTFTISLPLQSSLPAQSSKGLPVFAPTLLVIDDDPIAQRLVARILEGYDVVSCATYAEALERVEQGERFDAILVDVTLDGVGSLELFDKLTAIDAETGARVIFAAGGPIGKEAETRLRGLTNFCIRKPFDIRNLREVVSLVVNGD